MNWKNETPEQRRDRIRNKANTVALMKFAIQVKRMRAIDAKVKAAKQEFFEQYPHLKF